MSDGMIQRVKVYLKNGAIIHIVGNNGSFAPNCSIIKRIDLLNTATDNSPITYSYN